MNQPSSTITTAALAGLGMTLLWELVIQFDILGLNPRATLVAASVTFVSALAGYLKKENVLPMDR